MQNVKKLKKFAKNLEITKKSITFAADFCHFRHVEI